MESGRVIFTVGHSTRTLDQLVSLLRRHAVGRVADVRSFPASRRLAQFGKDELERSLPERGIDYVHLRELGGFRKPSPDSPNSGWKVGGFRGYADHMAGPEFAQALERLEALAAERPTAVMCAESLWWRCHRRLLSDALVVRGWKVAHIGARAEPELHSLTAFAQVEGDRIIYPAAQAALDV